MSRLLAIRQPGVHATRSLVIQVLLHGCDEHLERDAEFPCWWRVGRWLRKKHPRLNWKQIQRRYTSEGTFAEKGIVLFNPGSVSVTRYRYRGARIPNPWIIPPTIDPSGLRVLRASRHEQLSIERVQQAMA